MAGPGGDRMAAAAWIIAREAMALASVWSEQVPPSIRVYGRARYAVIFSQVGPSYPNEVKNVRHPVFGNRKEWVTNKYRPFLAPAAVAKADAAAAEIGMTIDDICHSLGYT